MPNQDYYKTLGLSRDASPDAVKKAYRRMALETHPDHNPDDSSAEERFKKISEAYAVLSDPGKRAQYDQYNRPGFGGPYAGGGPNRPGTGFGGYSQDEILRDMFKNGHAGDIFEEMQREFQRMGFRFDDSFINKTFFGGKDIFFQGSFRSGPGGVHVFRYGGGRAPGPRGPLGEKAYGETVFRQPKGLLSMGLSLLTKAGKKLGAFLLEKAAGVDSSGAPSNAASSTGARDMAYQVDITPRQAMAGATIQVSLPHMNGEQLVSLRIPVGVKSGAKLRLKGMGLSASNRPEQRGDVYITVHVA